MDQQKGKRMLPILIVYLAGIFMGAIDTGIVTPARTIIQNNLMVDDKTGIWMITIYTLAYAASIPVIGKLADRFGRKRIYLLSISLFGIGSLLCGLSHYAGSFGMLIAARVIQAIGGGGIMPVATAEFGTTFPPEKRGMALGLVGAVYGIANILGSLAGSAILDLFGRENWQYIFFVNIPISILIVVIGLYALPNSKVKSSQRIDGIGILLIVAMVLSLLYGLKQIDFFDFKNTIMSPHAYPYLIAFIIMLPIFILVEKKAQDPIINLAYFSSARIVITLVVAFISGFVLMGIVFIPQFCENSLKIPSGDGGYFTVILGLLSGVSAMLSGRLIDKYSAKAVLMLGFGVTVAGALFLIFVAIANPCTLTVVVSLMLLGFGLGFTMGAPVNYIMLENTRDQEANSALATLSLIRSIGTSIAPALMVGFIAHAGTFLQPRIMDILPGELQIPPLPYVQEISDQIGALKENPKMAEQLKGIDIPDFTSMETVKLNFDSGGTELPAEIIEAFKSSDVTTVTSTIKDMADFMFSQMAPKMTVKVQSGIQSGIDGITSGAAGLDKSISGLEGAYNASGKRNPDMKTALEQMRAARVDMEDLLAKMKALYDAVPDSFEQAKTGYMKELDSRTDQFETVYQNTLNEGYRSVYITVISFAAFAILLLLFNKKSANKSAI